MTPHAATRWSKAERFLEQTTRLSPADAPEATQLVQGDEQGRRFGRAFNLADKLRLVADYDDQKVPTAREAAELRATAIEFVAYCRSLL